MEQRSLENCSCHQDIDRMVNEGSGRGSLHFGFEEQQSGLLERPEEKKEDSARLKEEEGGV